MKQRVETTKRDIKKLLSKVYARYNKGYREGEDESNTKLHEVMCKLESILGTLEEED